MDSNHRSEDATDLQSAPIGHSGTLPYSINGAGGRIRTPDLLITKSFACKQKKRISHKVCRTGIFLGVEPEYHRANIKCVFSSELKMRRNREENKAVPINLF